MYVGNSEGSSGMFSTLPPEKLRKFCNVSLENINLKSWLQKYEDLYKASRYSTNGIIRSNEKEEITENSLITNIEKEELVCMENGNINLFEPIYQAVLPGSQIMEHMSLNGTKIAIIIKNVINESIMLKSGKMLQDKYFSLINEYIDTADSRTLCVFERYVSEDKTQTYLVDLIRIRNGAKENIYECLEHILRKHDLSLRNMTGVCVDNVIVMLERENSLIRRSVQTNEVTTVFPWIFHPMYSGAHYAYDDLSDDIEKLLQLVSTRWPLKD